MTGNNKGRVFIDAAACSQDIAPPTDLNLFDIDREKIQVNVGLL